MKCYRCLQATSNIRYLGTSFLLCFVPMYIRSSDKHQTNPFPYNAKRSIHLKPPLLLLRILLLQYYIKAPRQITHGHDHVQAPGSLGGAKPTPTEPGGECGSTPVLQTWSGSGLIFFSPRSLQPQKQRKPEERKEVKKKRKEKRTDSPCLAVCRDITFSLKYHIQKAFLTVSSRKYNTT